MRNLLLGTSDNIEKNLVKIKLWSDSFQPYGDVMLITLNAKEFEINLLKKCNIKVYNISTQGSLSVNELRIQYQHVVLTNKEIQDNYDLVFVTDVFDVVFQQDPSLKCDIEKYDLFMAYEGVLHCEEPWNMDVMKKCLPDEVETISNKLVICSGVLAGKPDKLAALFKHMDDMITISHKGHDIRDQAALNAILGKLHSNRDHCYYQNMAIRLFDLNDGWCIHCAVAGPTQFFEPWGFKASIERRYKIIPDFIDYDIVHQFNRIPEWNHAIGGYENPYEDKMYAKR